MESMEVTEQELEDATSLVSRSSSSRASSVRFGVCPVWAASSHDKPSGDPLKSRQYMQKMLERRRGQAAFRTVTIPKKGRPRSMPTTLQQDPSIVAQGKVVSFVSKESSSETGFMSLPHNYFLKECHPDTRKTLVQSTLMFTPGEPNKVIKSAAHKGAGEKISDFVLNPNSPTFVPRQSSQQNLTEGARMTKTRLGSGSGYKTAIPDRTYEKTPVQDQTKSYDVKFSVPEHQPDEILVPTFMPNPILSSKAFVDKKHVPVQMSVPVLSSDAFNNAKTQDYNVTRSGHENVPNHRSPNEFVSYGNEHRPRSQKSQLSPPYPGVVAVQERVCQTISNDRRSERDHFETAGPQRGGQKFSGHLKHPLYSHWSFWYFRNEKNKSWTENQIQIGSIGSVEAFWSSYQTLENPSSLQFGCDYAFFRNDIAPMWEHPGNRDGGRWIYAIDKQSRLQELDTLWEELLFALLGHGFGQFHDEICGAVINLREKGDKIALWTANADKEDLQMSIGRLFQALLQATLREPGVNVALKYAAHSDNSRRRNGTPRIRYEL